PGSPDFRPELPHPSRYGSDALTDGELGQGRPMHRCQVQVPPPTSGFAGLRFPAEVILLAVR
nr:hypothetical protein [Actinomycetota bacterium]